MEEPLMIRSSTRAPGSTLITSGSASVRSLARKASYLTSFRSGAAPAPPLFMPAILFELDEEESPMFMPAMLDPVVPLELDDPPIFIPDMPPEDAPPIAIPAPLRSPAKI